MIWSLGICTSLSQIAFHHRRVLRAEGGLRLSLDPTQHRFNTCLDPHVVQPHLKFAVECHEDCCTCLQLSSLVCHSSMAFEVRVCFRSSSKCYARPCSSNVPLLWVLFSSSRLKLTSQFHHFRPSAPLSSLISLWLLLSPSVLAHFLLSCAPSNNFSCFTSFPPVLSPLLRSTFTSLRPSSLLLRSEFIGVSECCVCRI